MGYVPSGWTLNIELVHTYLYVIDKISQKRQIRKLLSVLTPRIKIRRLIIRFAIVTLC